jgi:hypothetical protein
MAKFYVQSGNLEVVLQAHDSRCAAIWAVHRTLSPSLPFLCDEAADYLPLAEACRLGDAIRVSERGFDSPAAAWFDTLDIITEWNQLLVALDRLQDGVAGNMDRGGCP